MNRSFERASLLILITIILAIVAALGAAQLSGGPGAPRPCLVVPVTLPPGMTFDQWVEQQRRSPHTAPPPGVGTWTACPPGIPSAVPSR